MKVTVEPQPREFIRQNRLHAVGKRVIRIVVHFHKNSIRAYGDRRARKRQNFIAASGTVAWVHENREVA